MSDAQKTQLQNGLLLQDKVEPSVEIMSAPRANRIPSATSSASCLWHRILGSLLLLSIFVIVGLSMAVGYYVNLFSREGQECRTSSCVKAAARILKRIDSKVDPCENFYEFACGSYIENNVVPDDMYHRSTLQEMQEEVNIIIKKLIEEKESPDDIEAVKKAKKLYKSCMNTTLDTSSKEAKVLLNSTLSPEKLGPWPLLEGLAWDESLFSLEQVLAQLYIYQVSVFHEAYVVPGEFNPSKYVLQFFKGTTALERDYFINTTNPSYVNYLSLYRTLMKETLVLLRYSGENSVLEDDVDDLFAFEKEFANMSLFCDFDAENNSSELGKVEMEPFTIMDLMNTSPQINWVEMLNDTFGHLNLDYDISSLPIIVSCKEYFIELADFLDRTPNRVISNYVIWRFVFKYLPYFGNVFHQLWHEFKKQVPTVTDDKIYFSRWKECVTVVNEGFDMVAAHLYLQQHFDDKVTKDVRVFVKTMKKIFNEGLEHEDWLDEDTKEACQEKVSLMSTKIGYPVRAQKAASINKDYSEVEIKSDHFFHNMLRIRQFEVRKEMKKLSRPVDKQRDWLIPPLIVNAYHNPSANELLFPMGILRDPIYNPNVPMYLRYGTLGVVVAHEIAHAFDNTGRRYDKNGNVSSWWPEHINKMFTQKASCLAKQYSKFHMKPIDRNLDGNQTLGENICDNVGIQHAYYAYHKWLDANNIKEEPRLPGIPYTNEQIYFITFGQIWCEVLNKEGWEKHTKDVHSPGQYRTLGPIMNSPDFAKAFNCPLGSKMNPKDKCELWTPFSKLPSRKKP